MVRMTRVGATGAEIARETGLTRGHVYRIRRQTGLARPAPRITQAQERQMAALAAGGAPVAEIARTVGVSWPAVAARHPEAVWSTRDVALFGAAHRRWAERP